MQTKSKVTDSDIRQWIDNDESLYTWWLQSRQSKTVFIKENRTELVECIRQVIDRKPNLKLWSNPLT